MAARKKNRKSKKASWAGNIGAGWAHVQHVVDNVSAWCFQRIRDIGDKPESKKDDDSHPYVKKAKRLGKGALGFVGEVGDSFYETYADLKRKKK